MSELRNQKTHIANDFKIYENSGMSGKISYPSFIAYFPALKFNNY